MKKALSILLSLVVVLAALPLTAVNSFALTEGAWEYTVTNGAATITCWTGTDTDVLVPVTLGGYAVKRIEHHAFVGSPISITIPEGVTEIAGYAFRNCSRLEKLSIPATVTDIAIDSLPSENFSTLVIYGSANSYAKSYVEECEEEHLYPYYLTFTAFEDLFRYNAYGNIAEVTGCQEDLPCVAIPSTLNGLRVTAIGASAFEDNLLMTSVAIPDSVTRIHNYAFYNCSSLSRVVIPDSVKEIGSSVFYKCVSLSGITLPDSVTKIGPSAFKGCTSLTDVTVPDSVTSMGIDAFADCTSLAHYYCFKGSAADTYAANNGLTGAVHFFGDVNGDTDINVQDFGVLVNASLDDTNLTDEVARTVADFNRDGVVDALDCRLVKLLSQGKELPA